MRAALSPGCTARIRLNSAGRARKISIILKCAGQAEQHIDVRAGLYFEVASLSGVAPGSDIAEHHQVVADKDSSSGKFGAISRPRFTISIALSRCSRKVEQATVCPGRLGEKGDPRDTPARTVLWRRRHGRLADTPSPTAFRSPGLGRGGPLSFKGAIASLALPCWRSA